MQAIGFILIKGIIMNAGEFMVVMPSNASADVFPDNTTSSYKIMLQRPLPCAEGKWCVGLTEIMYPAKWKTIVNGTVAIKYLGRPGTAQITKFQITDGIYDNITMLLKEIDNNFAKYPLLEQRVRLAYNSISKSVSLFVAQGVSIQFSQNILNILGFKREADEYFTTGTYRASMSVDIMEGFSALFLYTNIVATTLVGDSEVPLLRVVPLKQSRANQSHIFQSFQHIQYQPVTTSQTDVIEINIRRDNGVLVPFSNGKVVITLHFKKTA